MNNARNRSRAWERPTPLGFGGYPYEIEPTPPGEWDPEYTPPPPPEPPPPPPQPPGGGGYYNPQADPVLTAFEEGYNLPSPAEQPGAKQQAGEIGSQPRYYYDRKTGRYIPGPRPGPTPWEDILQRGRSEFGEAFGGVKDWFLESLSKGFPWQWGEQGRPGQFGYRGTETPIPQAWATPGFGGYRPEWPPEQGPVQGTYPEFSPEGRQAVISAWEEATGKRWVEEKLQWESIYGPLGPDAIPKEIVEWYTQTHPPIPEEAITAYAQKTIDEEPVELPEDYETRSEAAKLYWLANNALDVAIFDRFGRLLSKDEALLLARAEPADVVTIGYFMGGDLVVEDQLALSAAVQSLPTFMGREAEARRAQREEALSEATLAKGEEEGEKTAEFEDKRAGILDNKDLSYHYMVARLDELCMSTFPPGPLWGTWQQKNREDAYNSQTPEQQKEVDEERKWGQYGDIPPSKARPETKPAEALDLSKLQESLATYGANITDNYPFISPLPESQLMRIPTATLKLMARYLSEKGLSWDDFLSISSSFYSGDRGGGGGQFAIPQQWGG